MTHAPYYNPYDHRGTGVPFAAFTDPFKTTGIVVYETFESVARFVAHVALSAVIKAREARTVGALSDLSDHTLKDIGIHRSEIQYVARQVARDPNFDPRAQVK